MHAQSDQHGVDVVDLGRSYARPETPRPGDRWLRSWAIRPSHGSGGCLPQSRLSRCHGSCQSCPRTGTARKASVRRAAYSSPRHRWLIDGSDPCGIGANGCLWCSSRPGSNRSGSNRWAPSTDGSRLIKCSARETVQPSGTFVPAARKHPRGAPDREGHQWDQPLRLRHHGAPRAPGCWVPAAASCCWAYGQGVGGTWIRRQHAHRSHMVRSCDRLRGG